MQPPVGYKVHEENSISPYGNHNCLQSICSGICRNKYSNNYA